MFRFPKMYLDGLEDAPAGGGTTTVADPTLKEQPTVKINVKGKMVDVPITDPAVVERLQKEFSYEDSNRALKDKERRLTLEHDRVLGELQSERKQREQLQNELEAATKAVPTDAYGQPDQVAILAAQNAETRQKLADLEANANISAAAEAFNEALEEACKGKGMADTEIGHDMVAARFNAKMLKGKRMTEDDLSEIAETVATELDVYVSDPKHATGKLRDAIVQEYLNKKLEDENKTKGADAHGRTFIPPTEPPKIDSAKNREEFRRGKWAEGGEKFLKENFPDTM